jgi:hypothetical protein
MKANEKNILIGGGILAVLVGGYFLINQNDNSGGAVDPTGNGAVQPGNAASNFNAKKVANELYDLMSFTIPNKTGIFNALRTVSQDQFGEVIKAFGKNKYNDLYGNTMEAFWETLTPRDLVYWLKQELGNEIQTLKLKYPKYL